MSNRGNPSDISGMGFTKGGIQKDTVASKIMSQSDTGRSGKELVSELQSAGALGKGLSGSDVTREQLSDAGFAKEGVVKKSLGAGVMSSADKTCTGQEGKAALQSSGAKK